MPKAFYQITNNEKSMIKTNRDWKTAWNNVLFGALRIYKQF